MRVAQPLLLLLAAAANCLPVDPDELLPAPAPALDAGLALATPAPGQIDVDLAKRQVPGDANTNGTEEEDTTITITVTTNDVVTEFETMTLETTVTSTVIATSTNFNTITETVLNADTATFTVFVTVTVFRTPLEARMTAAPRAMANLMKRDTITVTEFIEGDETTVEATTTEVDSSVVTVTDTTTVDVTIIITSYANAGTTVTVTSTLTVTSETGDPDATGADADASEDEDDVSLSTGGQIGIGVGVGVAGLFSIGAVIYYFIKKRKDKPEPDWYDPHNDLNDNANVAQPTVPAVSPSVPPSEMMDSNQGYRGASGPGTSPGLGPIAGGAAAAAAAAVAASKKGAGRDGWSGREATASPPSMLSSPDQAPYPTSVSPGSQYADMPPEPGRESASEMAVGQTHPYHAVEADSRPVVFEAPDRKYT